MSEGEIVETLPASVVVPMRSLAEVKAQRAQLTAYIQSELKYGVDYGKIPGCGDKPALFKPGAEKLLNLFGLGSRIVERKEIVDLDKNYAQFNYTVEVFHLATGRGIAQCEGSTNSQEKKYSKQPAVQQINTLMKMAQKRAIVGATILAVHGSDYFTQDIEDMNLGAGGEKEVPNEVSPPSQPSGGSGAFCEACGKELALSKAGTSYYCPNFKAPSQREHTRFLVSQLEEFKAHQRAVK